MSTKKRKIMENNLIFHMEMALRNEEFQVFFQPIIHTMSGSLCGFEALARWKHPQYGLLMPMQFIPVMESYNLIYRLDQYLIDKVCRLYREETDAGRPFVPVSVNLSRLDFEMADMFWYVEDTVAKYNMPREMINIEITESAFTDDARLMQDAIFKFRSAGYGVWMDDFGSGFSSLNLLKDYEFDELKIDMRFLSDTSVRSKKIISSVINMAKTLRMVTLAEGVETEEQIEFLRQIGCDRMQGFFYGKPQSYEKACENLRSKGIRFETNEERGYYHEINRVNLLSPSPFSQYEAGKMTHGGGIPLAIVEVIEPELHRDMVNTLDTEKDVYFLYLNEEMKDVLKLSHTRSASGMIDKLIANKILSWEDIDTFISDTIEKGSNRIDFMSVGDYVSVRGKLLSSLKGKNALLISSNNVTRSMDLDHDQIMNQKMRNIYNMYIRVSMLRIAEDEMEILFTRHENEDENAVMSIHRFIDVYAKNNVAPADREAFRDFVEPGTLEERIERSKMGFVNIKIETRDPDGTFTKKMYLAVPMGNHEVMLLVRYAAL